MTGKRRRFEMQLTEDEFVALEKEAKERTMSMKDVLFEKIQKGVLKNGSRIEASDDTIHEHTSLDKESSIDDVDSLVRDAVDHSNSWLGGYDWGKAARGIAVVYGWDDLKDADFEYFLGRLRVANSRNDTDPSDVANQIEIIAGIFQIDVGKVKERYRRIRVVGSTVSTV